MSRFFTAGSDSESESSSSEEEQVQVPQKAVSAATKVYPVSDDEEELKRVVRSEKDKRFEEMTEVTKQLHNHKKIRDMANVLNDFEVLTKAYEKAKKVVDKEGVPRFYVRCLAELEDFVNEVWEDREGRKTMSKNNAKGLTTLRQKLKKYNRDFDSDIAAYRENPDAGGPAGGDEGAAEESENEFVKDEAPDDSDEDDSQTDDDDVILPTGAFKAPAAVKDSKVPKDEDDESDGSTDWGSSSDDDSDSDDGMYAENPALRFLKKDVGTEGEGVGRKIKKDRQDRESKKKDRREDSDDDEEQEWKEVKGGVATTQERPKMFAKDQEINHDVIFKKLMEVISARGKKSTDRSGQIDLLKELRTISNTNKLGPAIEAKILFHTIAAVFDYNPNIAACMSAEIWTDHCLAYIRQLIEILFNNNNIHVSENVLEDSENFTTEPYRLRGCVFTMVERMDEEFTKMLQGCDAHSTEYVDRLRDERVVCDIIDELESYAVRRQSTSEETCRVYILKIKHIYYKFDAKIAELPAASGVPPGSSLETMRRLCQYIYAKDNTDRIRTQTILCHIYFLALHNRWFEARDLMLMSHLQDNVQHSDVPTQILYNRTMVQLGLCAFRQGMIKDAHNCLVDIQSSGRAKELLAQGLLLQRQHERTPEQEKIEKRRQMPYHMHINLELLECVYLVSAMLMEIPYMAAHELDSRRRLISKNFHHVLRISERQPLVGPPESMREHVVQASKAMKRGEWKACRDYLINEKMNSKVWGLFTKSDTVRAMIEQKIQEESLRTYLFTYSSVYDSLSLNILSEMFGLDRTIIHSVVSKMIINEELMASLDEPTQTVAMHRTEPSRLQSLALQLSEKVAALVDNNERIMEMKQGTFLFSGHKGGDRQGGYYHRDHQRDHHQGDRGGDRSYYQGDRGHHQGDRGHYHGDRSHHQGDRSHYQGDRGHYQGDRSHYQGDRGGGYQRDYQGGGQHGGWGGRRQNRQTKGY